MPVSATTFAQSPVEPPDTRGERDGKEEDPPDLLISFYEVVGCQAPVGKPLFDHTSAGASSSPLEELAEAAFE
jgi:hypothetical protein